ncbi:TPA: hypothetical protein ACH3X3_003596 [Trebouxia sp. C0006]
MSKAAATKQQLQQQLGGMNGNAVPFFPKLAAAKQLQQEDSGKKEGAGLFGRQGAGLLQQQQANSPKIPAVKGGLDLLLDAGQRVNSPSFSPHPPERKPLGGCCHPDPHLPGPRPEELYLLALQLFKAYLEDPRLLAHCLVPGVPLLLGPLLMSGASLHQAALLVPGVPLLLEPLLCSCHENLSWQQWRETRDSSPSEVVAGLSAVYRPYITETRNLYVTLFSTLI